MSKKSILEEAVEITGGERCRDYGHPYDNCKLIAELWQPILGCRVTPQQVAMCMIQVKIAREQNTPKRDNAVDIAGYAYVLDMINQWEDERKATSGTASNGPQWPGEWGNQKKCEFHGDPG